MYGTVQLPELDRDRTRGAAVGPRGHAPSASNRPNTSATQEISLVADVFVLEALAYLSQESTTCWLASTHFLAAASGVIPP
jgi:hypothetical protein